MKTVKIIITVILGLGLLFTGFLFGVYYFKIGKYAENNEKYPHYIGYLDPENTFSPEGFKVCGEKEAIFKTHHGAPKIAYAPNKGAYDKRIRANFSKDEFKDSGYINFRFIVNCDGVPGRFETIQTDLDLEEIEHHPDLVKHLLALTAASENWNVFTYKDQPRNYYTYVSYKIENGKIKEILP